MAYVDIDNDKMIGHRGEVKKWLLAKVPVMRQWSSQMTPQAVDSGQEPRV